MDERNVDVTVVAPAAGSDDRLRAQALALMFIAGATLALVVLALPDTGGVDRGPWAVNASLGLPVGVLLWRWGHQVPELALHACLLAGAALVAVGMTFGDGESVTVAASFFFIWVALYSFLFFPWRAAAAHLVVDALMLAIALAVADVNAAAGVALLVVGTSAVVGTVTGQSRVALDRLASTDPLTGLPNRRRLGEALDAEAARSARSGVPFSVIVIDLDGFKKVNDEQGHAAGDRILIASGQAWLGCLRPTDLLTRYGGDEFVALLPGCGAAEAAEVAHRLADAVAWSCSLGAATSRQDEDPDAVLRRADEHLLRAKGQGGGRAVSRAADG